MSELHISLGIIGLFFIAAVFLFNRWQELKYRRQAERMFRGERQDVLFDDSSNKSAEARIEPSFHSAYAAPSVAEGQPTKASRAVASAGTSTATVTASHVDHPLPSEVEVPIETAVPRTLIDESIDLIGIILLKDPVPTSTVKALSGRAQTFSKPVHWEGAVGERWSGITLDSQYTELRVALQLADRRGPASDAEIARFISLIKQFAVELDGSVQMETNDSAAARATELDEFCADVDMEIGVNFAATDQTMPGTKLRALAESSGLKLNTDGVFHLYEEHGLSLFTLRNAEPRPFMPEYLKNISTRSITLLLDVPRVPHGVRAFNHMLDLGRHIASVFEGNIVDDNGKPLTDAGADSIRKHLETTYRKMEGFGIPAGSLLAQRLFA